MKGARDRETRQRLLSAAARLFAERGFGKEALQAPETVELLGGYLR